MNTIKFANYGEIYDSAFFCGAKFLSSVRGRLFILTHVENIFFQTRINYKFWKFSIILHIMMFQHFFDSRLKIILFLIALGGQSHLKIHSACNLFNGSCDYPMQIQNCV